MSTSRSLALLALPLLAGLAAGARAQDTRPAIAPRPERLAETIVTATRRDEKVFDVPYTAHVVDSNDLQERLVRTTNEALSEVPSTMGQKTAFGQGSPFLRGFTGYQTLFLIDGIRLNNSVFRSGPNQYSSTIDPFGTDRYEVVLGPSSVLYGSDAVGGTVNAISKRRTRFERGVHGDGRQFTRLASAERSVVGRLEVGGNVDDRFGAFAGVTGKQFGDLVAGSGTREQPETGYGEHDGDVHLDVRLDREWTFSTAYQRVQQDDVPRTHTTVFSESFHGTAAGTELRREHDQLRELVYGRFERHDGAGSDDSDQLTVWWHHQREERDRLRPGAQHDVQGFDVQTPGVSFQMVRESPIGVITAGLEYTRDFVDSFRTDFTAGVPAVAIQGPVGDDATYDLAGAYVQDQVALGALDLVGGVRFTYARVEANEVDDPTVPGTSPSTPGNVIQVDDSWNHVTGSLRAVYHATDDLNFFGGVSQAFRAPNLSDLTSSDETSVVEVPSPGLDPETFLQEEIGVKARGESWNVQVAWAITQLRDALVVSPTGGFVGMTPIGAKSNVGDGWIQTAEATGAWTFAKSAAAEDWTAYGGIAWMASNQRQVILPAGTVVHDDVSRTMPLQGILGLRVGPADGAWFAEIEGRAAGEADKLSVKDVTDTQRIPPGGTPGWGIVSLRGGLRLSDSARATIALENLLNENYRIHGSGVNEPGRNLVFGLEVLF